MNKQDRYLIWKKRFAVIMGLAVLWVSFIFSASGFGFETGKSEWIGWILAFAVTSAELVFNTKVKNLNWTIVFVGVMAYLYSIYTNIIGFYVQSGQPFLMNQTAILPILAGIFIDVFPEMALSWGFDASNDGDVIGNLVKLSGGPDINPEIKQRLPTYYKKNPNDYPPSSLS